MIAMFYFMSSQHQIQFNYYMFVYYFTGNFIFGSILYFWVASPVDRPFYAMRNLKRDIADAERN